MPVASAVTSGKESKAGAVVSTTLTWKVPVTELRLASVAVQDTSVWPSENKDPDAGEQTTVGLLSAMSVAVGRS